MNRECVQARRQGIAGRSSNFNTGPGEPALPTLIMPEDDALNNSRLLFSTCPPVRRPVRLASPLLLLVIVACAGCGQPSGAPIGSGGEPVAQDDSTRPENTSSVEGSPAPAAPADPAAGGRVAGSDEAGEPKASPAGSAGQPISSPDQLAAALKEKNPGFDGEPQMQPISADLLALAINDPKVKDISPLARQRIGALDLSGCDITDLSPLQGLPLSELYLEDNRRLTDISALRGMPLQKLYLSRTRVENLGPLRGAPLAELNLLGTSVKDLAPLAECPLTMLWLTGCPVADLAPLARVPLVSLTLQDTRVADLSPLANTSLQRLHIGGAEVTDLTPLGTLQLTRLIFTPSKIKAGLDVVRQMGSLQELGTRFDDTADDKKPPAAFWELYDKGELK